MTKPESYEARKDILAPLCLLKVVSENLFHLKMSNRKESWSISIQGYYHKERREEKRKNERKEGGREGRQERRKEGRISLRTMKSTPKNMCMEQVKNVT